VCLSVWYGCYYCVCVLDNIGQTTRSVQLVVLPYNYQRLFQLLADLKTAHRMVPSQRWRGVRIVIIMCVAVSHPRFRRSLTATCNRCRFITCRPCALHWSDLVRPWYLSIGTVNRRVTYTFRYLFFFCFNNIFFLFVFFWFELIAQVQRILSQAVALAVNVTQAAEGNKYNFRPFHASNALSVRLFKLNWLPVVHRKRMSPHQRAATIHQRQSHHSQPCRNRMTSKRCWLYISLDANHALSTVPSMDFSRCWDEQTTTAARRHKHRRRLAAAAALATTARPPTHLPHRTTLPTLITALRSTANRRPSSISLKLVAMMTLLHFSVNLIPWVADPNVHIQSVFFVLQYSCAL